jgi:hypothetical protein
MKIVDNLLILNTADRLRIQWNDLPFNLNISVLWRGVYFPVSIKAFKIHNGSTRSVAITYRRKTYEYILTKWKYMGGHKGDYFPEIETRSNKLKFQLALDFFEICDEPKGSLNLNVQGDNSFIVFYQS